MCCPPGQGFPAQGRCGGRERRENRQRQHRVQVCRGDRRELWLGTEVRRRPRPQWRPPRRHGLQGLLQGREDGQGVWHASRVVHRHAPGPWLAQFGARVRGRLQAQGLPDRRAGVQRRGVPPHGPGAQLHGGRVRGQRRHQPPRALFVVPPVDRRHCQVQGPPRHHRRVRDREHEHSGGPGSAAGGFGRPPRPRRGTGGRRERDD
mmetsp:Transcript_3814/g.11451  ORF Transcript_3814/g.11451 Transcript_3814/m.11451 type:complete len:205 (-) Transcript_3814:603-1217(-)